MSVYKRKDRMYYRGGPITDDVTLRAAEYVYVDSDPEPHRPKHVRWGLNRPYFSVKYLLERRGIYVAVRNPEYIRRPPALVCMIHSYLVRDVPQKETIKLIEDEYPILKHKEIKENEPF